MIFGLDKYIHSLKVRMSREHSSRLYLCLQKRNVLIDGCATKAAHTGKLANIEMVAFVCRVVPKEDCRDALNRNLRPPDPLPLGSGIRHSRAHTAANSN